MIMDKTERANLFAAYQRYLSAFNANDLDGINDCINYPLAYIGADNVTMLDQFPLDPADMKASKGWDRSDAFEIDVVAVGENKAHLLMRNTRRLRKDGSLIEEATGFYAYTKVDGDWKIFALSDIVFPA
jgi:hypothetical protein